MGCNYVERNLLHDGICAMIKGSGLPVQTILSVLETAKESVLKETIAFSGEEKRQRLIIEKDESPDDINLDEIKRSFLKKYSKKYY